MENTILKRYSFGILRPYCVQPSKLLERGSSEHPSQLCSRVGGK